LGILELRFLITNSCLDVSNFPVSLIEFLLVLSSEISLSIFEKFLLHTCLEFIELKFLETIIVDLLHLISPGFCFLDPEVSLFLTSFTVSLLSLSDFSGKCFLLFNLCSSFFFVCNSLFFKCCFIVNNLIQFLLGEEFIVLSNSLISAIDDKLQFFLSEQCSQELLGGFSLSCCNFSLSCSIFSSNSSLLLCLKKVIKSLISLFIWTLQSVIFWLNRCFCFV
jgi:hypothetical protein